MPKFIVPEELLQGELWLDTMVHRWFSFCQEQFDIDDYSRAVRDVRTDWTDDGKSPKKKTANGSSCVSGGGVATQTASRLSWGERALVLRAFGEREPAPVLCKSDVPYEELWLDRMGGQTAKTTEGLVRSINNGCSTSAALPYPGPCSLSAITSLDVSLTPPPVPPKSEAVKEECRLLNAPPIPPRSSKQMPSVPVISKPRQQETRSPSPTLSYYSSGLHNMYDSEKYSSFFRQILEYKKSRQSRAGGPRASDQTQACYPCNWTKTKSNSLEPPATTLPAPLPSEGMSSRLSWPNHLTRDESQCTDEFLPSGCRSYYSYPRKRTHGSQKACTSSLVDFDGRDKSQANANVTLQTMSLNQFCVKSSSCNSEMDRDKPIEESDTKQSLSCPILPPRTAKSNAIKTNAEAELACDSKEDSSDISIEQDTTEASCSNPASPDNPAFCPTYNGSLRPAWPIDGNLLLQLTEEILSEDFKLSKLQVKKLMQFMNGWRPKI
ncbi:hypothetical protein WMY93_029641 [Mugilogobius chulae]|uniref:Uncharacterized protein n=1 Tax=Mugilogobius chulae TaxID=88201 RepID=A0AAW0MVL9_9GOBI